MRRLFDDFAGGEYDRPNQRWVCGKADECTACPFGPTPQGACPEEGECEPVKDGDRWRCNRPPTRGGPCEEEHGGPTPDGQCCRVNKCTPRTSLRVRRGRLALGAALLFAGLAAFFIGSPWRSEALAPGPLTHSHAQLLARGDWSNRCAACHTNQDKALITLAIGTLTGQGNQETTQSHLCMKCHEKLIDGKSFLLAHGLPQGALESSDGREVGCSACHQEHHGAMYNLTAISSARCQSCHQQKYDSFAGAHPDFGAWPYERRTRVAFDHVSHMKKHYAEKGKDFACAQCHKDGPRGEAMVLANYTGACAECHDAGIRTSAGAGLAMISLPSLDLEALSDHGQKLNRWPAAATGDFDGELPAALKLLFSDNPALGALLKKYGPAFNFLDIDPDSPDDARHVARLANETTKLIARLDAEGQSALVARLEKSVGRKLTQKEAAALTAGLPVDLVHQAATGWFGKTEATDSELPIDKVKKHPSGGWFKSDTSLSLRYTPQGHADPLLKSWIDLVVSLDDSKAAVRESALAELATAKSPGQCLMCHSTEKSPNGSLFVNWRPLDASTKPRGFTRFAHGPHVTIKELADCTACHRFDERADSTASYASLDPTAFVSHFHPITKAECATCHTPQAAGDSCSQCHNYHVGPGAKW